eukprot:5487546-Prymnesium_polylepis.1
MEMRATPSASRVCLQSTPTARSATSAHRQAKVARAHSCIAYATIKAELSLQELAGKLGDACARCLPEFAA